MKDRRLRARHLSFILVFLALGCARPYAFIQGIAIALPDGFREGYLVRDYIISDSYLEDTVGLQESEKIDLIYRRSLLKTQGRPTAASLATLIAVLEHRHLPLSFFGLTVDIPLTLEERETFDTRVERLPHHFYDPQHSDRDKLQHYFANAWLKRGLGMQWLVNLISELVEIGEEGFVKGGAYDDRDKVANSNGVAFARYAKDSLDARPSHYLTRNP